MSLLLTSLALGVTLGVSLITFQVPLRDFWPDTMHYDPVLDLIFLLYINNNGGAQFCSIPSNETFPQLTCSPLFAGNFGYTPDSSAFDRLTRIIWTVVTGDTKNYLLGFNVDNSSDVQAVAVGEVFGVSMIAPHPIIHPTNTSCSPHPSCAKTWRPPLWIRKVFWSV